MRVATEQIGQLGEPLSIIVQSVQEVQDQTSQIATAVEEQSFTSDEIAKNIVSTSHIAQQIETLPGEIMGEAKSVKAIAEKLKVAGERFTIDMSS